MSGGVPREQQMLEGHLPGGIYHRVYSNVRRVLPAAGLMDYLLLGRSKLSLKFGVRHRSAVVTGEFSPDCLVS